MAFIDKFAPQNQEEVNTIRRKLKECKEEWVERLPGNRGTNYIGQDTVRQILDRAVSGITYWDFTISKQWKEEVFAFNKNNQSWAFDGYVYHVQGSLFIPGLGRHEQFGSKVAVGGTNNQDSAYKSAASDCFTKCAAMFGVGEAVYSRLKVEEEQHTQQVEQQQQQPQQPQMQQQQQQVQQQPETQHWQPQQQQQGFQQQQQQQWEQPQQQQAIPQQQQQQWSQQQQWPQGNQQENFNHGQAQQEEQNETPNPDLVNEGVEKPIEQTIQEVDQMFAQGSGNINLPFNQAPETEVQQGAEVNQSEASPIQFQLEPQGEEPVPVEVEQEESQEQPQVKQEEKTTLMNPWSEQGVILELQKYATHKERLNISSDDLLTPYLRDFFKSEEATQALITPENIKDFNSYLESIAV